MRLSVCIDALFRNQDFTKSVSMIKAAGCDTIEFWSWWDKDLQLVKQSVSEAGVTISAFCTKFISLVDPSKRSAYLEGLKASIEAAHELNCSQLITQVGQELKDVSRETQRASLIEGLQACVPLLEQAGITLLVEPLNTAVDHPGYFLSSSAEAFEVIRQIGSPHVSVLYDIYHQQITEGHLTAAIQQNIAWIGHFHAAGAPGRRELDTGELAYDRIFQVIKETGYTGAIGLEYFPGQEPLEGLNQVTEFMKRLSHTSN